MQLKSVSTLSAKGGSHPEAGQQGKESALFSQVNLGGRKAGDPWQRGLGYGDGHLPGLLMEVSTARVLGKRSSKLRLQSNFMEEQPRASPWPRDRLRSGVQHHLHQIRSSCLNSSVALRKPPDLLLLQALFLNLTSSSCTASHGNVLSKGSILPSQPEVFVQKVAANHPLLGLLICLCLSTAVSAVTAKVLPGCHSKGAHSLLGCPQGGHVFSCLIPFFFWRPGS